MNKKEVSEIKRRFKKDTCTVQRIAGCYVNGNKEKVITFSKNFLNLPDEDFYKYLELAKKSLSGKIDNNLINLEFPRSEEESGGKQDGLMALRNTGLKDDGILQSFYDLVINHYDCVGNYLILLFHDIYDIPLKTSDEIKNDESDEAYNYILCAICPVDLSKPALGVRAEQHEIGARERDWVVGMPESGFLFPSFNDRSTDIHETLVYTKNTKEPHKELWEDILGCSPEKLTSDEKKEAFFHIVVGDDPEDKDERKVMLQKVLADTIAEQEESGDSSQTMSKDNTVSLLKDVGVENARAEKMADECISTLGEQMPQIKELVSQSEIKKIEEKAEKTNLVKENERLKAMLPEHISVKDENVVVNISREKEAEIRFSEDSGIYYMMIPVEASDHIVVNGKERKH